MDTHFHGHGGVLLLAGYSFSGITLLQNRQLASLIQETEELKAIIINAKQERKLNGTGKSLIQDRAGCS